MIIFTCYVSSPEGSYGAPHCKYPSNPQVSRPESSRPRSLSKLLNWGTVKEASGGAAVAARGSNRYGWTSVDSTDCGRSLLHYFPGFRFFPSFLSIFGLLLVGTGSMDWLKGKSRNTTSRNPLWLHPKYPKMIGFSCKWYIQADYCRFEVQNLLQTWSDNL